VVNIYRRKSGVPKHLSLNGPNELVPSGSLGFKTQNSCQLFSCITGRQATAEVLRNLKTMENVNIFNHVEILRLKAAIFSAWGFPCKTSFEDLADFAVSCALQP
jgi:hypothetical protein